jgi:hypothetical protein
MRLIAHRGLTDGANKNIENTPNQIAKALSQGFDCEIDVWYSNGKYLLGHDEPTYLVDQEFLKQPSLWIHCKNHDAMREMRGMGLNYFWHQEDDITLTSWGHFWTYPGKTLYDCSVAVMPEWHMPISQVTELKCYGVCSDYVGEIRDFPHTDA